MAHLSCDASTKFCWHHLFQLKSDFIIHSCNFHITSSKATSNRTQRTVCNKSSAHLLTPNEKLVQHKSLSHTCTLGDRVSNKFGQNSNPDLLDSRIPTTRPLSNTIQQYNQVPNPDFVYLYSCHTYTLSVQFYYFFWISKAPILVINLNPNSW